MRACLHLHSKTSENSLFYQILMYDIDLKVGDILDYNEHLYLQLKPKEMDQFDQTKLKLGKYHIFSTRIEEEMAYGYIRYLFLREL